MALGTPIDRGTAQTDYSSANLVSNTFTPSADSLLLVLVVVRGSSAVTGITGHDGGTSWINIQTSSYGGNLRTEVWGAHSGASPSSGAITVSVAGTPRKQANFAEVTGADVSGTIANTFADTDNGSGYGSSVTRTLSPATSLTMGFWGDAAGTLGTPEGTQVNALQHSSTNQSSVIDYDAAGDASPSYTLSGTAGFATVALEIKEGISTSATVTGTAIATINESDIVAGGKTVIITLTGDTWVTSGATFDAQRQNIINSILNQVP